MHPDSAAAATETDAPAPNRRRRRPADVEADGKPTLTSVPPTEEGEDGPEQLDVKMPKARLRSERRAEFDAIVKVMNAADWAQMPGAEKYRDELREELEEVEADAEEALWNGEKIPSGKEIAAWRAQRVQLKRALVMFENPMREVESTIRAAITAERTRKTEYPVVTGSEPLPWENTDAEWMKAAEDFRHGRAPEHPFAADPDDED